MVAAGPGPAPAGVVVPGYLDGGFVHASLGARGLRALWSAVVGQEGAAKYVGALIGVGGDVDLAAVDPVVALGLDPGAPITATVGRSVGPLGAVRMGVQMLAAADPAAEAPLPDDLLRAAGALYVHSRVHLPALSPEQLLAKLRPAPEPAGLCARLPAHDGCSAAATGVTVLRRQGDAVVVDLFISAYPQLGSLDDVERVDAISAGLAAAPPERPEGVVAGDLVVDLHGSALPEMFDHWVHVFLINRLRDTPAADRSGQIRYTLGMRDAALRLRDTRRLFRGVRLSATLESEVRLEIAWQPVDDAAASKVDALFARVPDGLSAPPIAALCHDARACGRVARLPAADRFAALAVGEYVDQGALDRATAEAGVPLASLVFVLETWPNLIASLTRWHERPDAGPDALAIRDVVDLAERIDSAGLRVARTDDPNLAYARLRADELPYALKLAAHNNITLTDAPIAELPHTIATGSFAGLSTFVVTDPDARAGWVMATDNADHVRWLLADVALEPISEPALYLATDDLGELARTLGLSAPDAWQPRLARRSLQLRTDVIAGSPRIHLTLGPPAD